MITLKEVSSENLKFIHEIYPGDNAKYWVDFNWYWAALSGKIHGIESKLIFINKVSEPIGFIAYGRHFKDRQLKDHVDNHFEIYHFVIDSKLQGLGLGKMVTMKVMKELAHKADCQKVLVACNPDNKIATRFYKNLGFVENGKNYDDDPLYSFEKEKALVLVNNTIEITLPDIKDIKNNLWEAESIQGEKEFSWSDWSKGI